MSIRSMPRRQFLKHTATAGAAVLTAPMFVRAIGTNDRLNVAVIGVGGRGAYALNGVSTETVVALCDVDRAATGKVAEKYRDAFVTTDFRRVFDQANKFDAVTVSTCEHTHAVATLTAMKLGKHVYCEKPLTHNIAEARVIREYAAKTKLATQMGNQNHSNDSFRRVVELIQTGAIGPVRQVHVWVSRTWGLQPPEEAAKNENHRHFGPEMYAVTGRPTKAETPPPDLDWDLWLGPAPARPFSSLYVPGPKWYRWWAFGNGTMSDLGSHWNDLPFWALKLKAPQTVEAFGPPPNPEIAPATMRCVYEYGPRGDMPAVTMTWYQGKDKPPAYTEKRIPQWPNGMLFVGDKGMLLADYTKFVLLPEKQYEGFQRPEPFLPNSPGHYAEWILACKTGSPTGSNFEYAGWLTEANHLGNVAYRVGKKLEWDAEAMKATNCPQADEFIHREYRKGWSLT
jgi:predicted dehydrogenase